MNILNKSPLEPVYLPSTKRPDGSFRKTIKIKPGFLPSEEIPRYLPPCKRNSSNSQVKYDKNNIF